MFFIFSVPSLNGILKRRINKNIGLKRIFKTERPKTNGTIKNQTTQTDGKELSQVFRELAYSRKTQIICDNTNCCISNQPKLESNCMQYLNKL